LFDLLGGLAAGTVKVSDLDHQISFVRWKDVVLVEGRRKETVSVEEEAAAFTHLALSSFQFWEKVRELHRLVTINNG